MSMKTMAIGALTSMGMLAAPAHAAVETFTTVGAAQFIVPVGVTSIDVLLVGGGGGGANGHQGGGGAGQVLVQTLTVTAGQTFALSVGAGGTGAVSQNADNVIVGLTAGGATTFGALSADGGQVVNGINLGGHDGSSGGGAACNAGSLGGAGGSGGTNGQACQSGSSMPLGFGAGDYLASLVVFDDVSVTAGAGGAGGTGTHAGGGGAGGVLLDLVGPSGGDGLAAFSALGGQGYGAGGGAGGLDVTLNEIRFGGGDGADGLVLVEYAAVVSDVPLPAGGALLLSAFGLAAGLRRRG